MNSLIGQSFKFLTVESKDDSIRKTKNRAARWICKCVCGNKISARTDTLKQGKKKSCGCQKSRPSNSGNKNYKWSGYEEISGAIWNSIKDSATSRNLEFSISIEQAWQLFIKQGKRCAITSVDIFFGKNSKRTASLDRIDSSLGYTIDNVQWVHKEINRMKWNMNQKDFINWCKLVSNSIVS